MNREIKFRAWDKRIDRMRSDATPMRSSIWWHNGASFDSCGKDYDVMQFTGIKDKNGKEIYEGDVVLIHDYNTIEAVADGANPNELFEVRWLGSFWSYGEEPISNWIGAADVDTSAEVVGNIYENGDLLSR